MASSLSACLLLPVSYNWKYGPNQHGALPNKFNNRQYFLNAPHYPHTTTLDVIV